MTYVRPRDCFQPTMTRKPRRTMSRRYILARYAVDGPVLPLVQKSLPAAEQFRRELMGRYRRIRERNEPSAAEQGGGFRFRSEVFSGKDEEGRKLQDSHKHAYYLPSDEDADGRIDHMTVVAEMGFGRDELRTLDSLRQLHLGDGDPLNLLLIALDDKLDGNGPLFAASKWWISATPFVSTRHPKRRGVKRDPPHLLGEANRDAFLQAVLGEEIERLRDRRPEIPRPSEVEPILEHRIGVRQLRPIQFSRFRQKRGDDGGQRPAGAFRLVFPTPVAGPISLGHSSHFGLGLFVPDQDR